MTASPEMTDSTSVLASRVLGSRSLAVASCLLVVCLVAACSSSSHPGGTSTNSTAASDTSAGSQSSTHASSPAGGGSSTSAASGGSLSTTCPTEAQIKSATGDDIPLAEHSSTGGDLVCSYNATATGQNLVVTVSPTAGTTAAIFKGVINSQAAAQHVTATALPGYGQAAYRFTMNDAAANSDHVATTTLGIYAGASFMIISGTLSLDQVEAAAKLLLH